MCVFCFIAAISYLYIMKVNCKHCGIEHEQRPANIKRGWGNYCSKSCAAKNRVRLKKEVLNNAVCAHCSVSFYIRPSKVKKGEGKYCSIKCKKFGMYPQLVGDEKKQCLDCKRVLDRSEYRRDKRGKILARCAECHRKYDNQNKKKYKDRIVEYAKKYRENNLKNKIKEGLLSLVTPCKCVTCGKGFVKKGTKSSEFCSKECFVRKVFVKKEVERVCKSCGAMFIGKHPGNCLDCRNKITKQYAKAYKKKRKASVRTAATQLVIDRKVFDRDKWRCKSCNCKVQKENMYADNAAEVDHIVPISLGGPHSYSNTQTLCRRCNGAKSNKYSGQLVMAI